MNKAFEKILDRLVSEVTADTTSEYDNGIKSAISIVQEVTKEYNITNGDKIRSMSDDELAEFIEQVSTDIMDTISFGTKNYEEIWEHKEVVLKYLQSKA